MSVAEGHSIRVLFDDKSNTNRVQPDWSTLTKHPWCS